MISQIILTLLLAVFLGQVYLALAPIFMRNMAFLGLLPVLCAIFIGALINPISVIYMIIYSRAMLEPILGLSRSDVGGMSIGLGAGVNLMVLLYTAFLSIKYSHRLSKISFLRYYLIYLGIVFLSVFYAPEPALAFRMFLNFSTYAAMGIIPFFLINSKQTRNNWLRHLTFTTFLPILAADIDLVRGGTVNWSGMRVMGTFPHPNMLGFYLTFVIALIFLVLKNKEFKFSSRMQLILKAFFVNAFLLLLFTKTRNAWVACWLFFFIYGLLQERRYLIFTLVLPPLLLLIPEFSYRIIELLQGDKVVGGDDPDQLNSWAWRVQLWKDAFVWIFRNPFMGYGFTSFKSLSPKFSEMLGGQNFGAHNVYVEILFETGIFGLLAYCSIYFNAISRFIAGLKSNIKNTSCESAILLAFVVSYLMVCIADNIQYYLVLNWYVWFFIGCMLVPVESLPSSNSSAKSRILN